MSQDNTRLAQPSPADRLEQIIAVCGGQVSRGHQVSRGQGRLPVL